MRLLSPSAQRRRRVSSPPRPRRRIFIKKPLLAAQNRPCGEFSSKSPLAAAQNRPTGKFSAKFQQKSLAAAQNQPQRQNFIKKPSRRRRISLIGGEKIAQAIGRRNNGKNSSLSRQKQRKLSKTTDPINNITSKSSPLSTTHKNPFKHYSKPNTLLLARSITEASSEAR